LGTSERSQHFHFILGHYHEPNGVQFGLLRRDLTPRPAYVALAAVGRLLAGARTLGWWHPDERKLIGATFLASSSTADPCSDGWVRLRGDFTPDFRAVVAFRCVAE
jgi:hypothetical protein